MQADTELLILKSQRYVDSVVKVGGLGTGRADPVPFYVAVLL